MTNALRLLTGRDTVDRMTEAWSSAAWYAKEETVRSAEYFVCVRPGTREPFFIAKIDNVEPVPESGHNRWALMFRQYAEIDGSTVQIRSKQKPDKPEDSKNPIISFDLERALQVPLDSLGWKEVGERKRQWPFSPTYDDAKPSEAPTVQEAIQKAKRLLAASLRIRPDQIDIIIRG